MKLKTQIFISFLFCLTLSFVLLMVNLQKKIVDINQRNTEEFNSQLITSKAGDIGHWLNQRITEMRIMSESEEFKTRDWESMKHYVERLNKRLQTEYGNPAETFGLVDGDGKGWIHDGLTIDVSRRSYFQEAVITDKEYTLSHPVISKSDELPIILICYPVYGSMGEKHSYINGSLSLQKIEGLAAGVKLYDGTGFIIDGEGKLLSSDGAASSPFTQENFHLIRECGNQICTIRDEQGKNHYVLSSLIPYSNDWRLCVVVSEKALHAQTNQLIQSVIMIWLLVLFLSILLSIWLSRVLTKPLSSLEACIKEAEKGDFKGMVPTTGNLEFVRIGQSFNHMLMQIQQLMEQNYQEQQKKRTAELQVLQSQINPHFLYNTLDTIRWKAYDEDTKSVIEMIDALSDFFRISLSKGRETIPLFKEVEHVSRYLFIQNIRYEGKMSYRIEFDEQYAHYSIIKLLIQPLVENAIYHGIKPSRHTCSILIQIMGVEDFLVIHVTDDGEGMTKERLFAVCEALENRSKSTGYGLYNVNERIVLAYGEGFGVGIMDREGGGTCVTLKLPLIRYEMSEGEEYEGVGCG